MTFDRLRTKCLRRSVDKMKRAKLLELQGIRAGAKSSLGGVRIRAGTLDFSRPLSRVLTRPDTPALSVSAPAPLNNVSAQKTVFHTKTASKKSHVFFLFEIVQLRHKKSFLSKRRHCSGVVVLLRGACGDSNGENRVSARLPVGPPV